MDVVLRPLVDADLDAVYAWMCDADAVRMAAFTAEDPADRSRFDAWMARNRGVPQNLHRAIEADGRLAGTISSFWVGGDRELSYWIDPACWGRGVASAALGAFLAVERHRPVIARTAEGNEGSARVLRRNGFVAVGTDRGFAAGRGAVIEETIHRLDG